MPFHASKIHDKIMDTTPSPRASRSFTSLNLSFLTPPSIFTNTNPYPPPPIPFPDPHTPSAQPIKLALRDRQSWEEDIGDRRLGSFVLTRKLEELGMDDGAERREWRRRVVQGVCAGALVAGVVGFVVVVGVGGEAVEKGRLAWPPV